MGVAGLPSGAAPPVVVGAAAGVVVATARKDRDITSLTQVGRGRRPRHKHLPYCSLQRVSYKLPSRNTIWHPHLGISARDFCPIRKLFLAMPSEFFYIRGTYVGMLLGRGGWNLRRIEDDTNTDITVVSRGRGTPVAAVLISGRTRRDVDAAYDEVVSITGAPIGWASLNSQAREWLSLITELRRQCSHHDCSLYHKTRGWPG